jgi:hypothetical protein
VCVCVCVRERERDDTVFSVVGLFYVLRVARKFDFRLAVKKTPNKGRLIFLKKLHNVGRLMFLAGSVYFHPDRRREC